MEAITAGNEVTLQRLLLPVDLVTYARRVRFEVVDRHPVHVEIEGLAYRETGCDQVFDDFLLTINHDGAPRQLLKIDSMALTGEIEKNAVMEQPLLHHPGADTGGIQDFDALMLQDAGSNAVFNVFLTPRLQDHALDPAEVQKMSQQQPRRASTNDRNLGTHGS